MASAASETGPCGRGTVSWTASADQARVAVAPVQIGAPQAAGQPRDDQRPDDAVVGAEAHREMGAATSVQGLPSFAVYRLVEGQYDKIRATAHRQRRGVGLRRRTPHRARDGVPERRPFVARANAAGDRVVQAHVVGIDDMQPADSGGGEQRRDVRSRSAGAVHGNAESAARREHARGRLPVSRSQGGQLGAQSRRRRPQPVVVERVGSWPHVSGVGEGVQSGPVQGGRDRARRGRRTARSVQLPDHVGVDAFDQHSPAAEFELDGVPGPPEHPCGGVQHHARAIHSHRDTVAREGPSPAAIHRQNPIRGVPNPREQVTLK